jgi:hypothetical protein
VQASNRSVSTSHATSHARTNNPESTSQNNYTNADKVNKDFPDDPVANQMAYGGRKWTIGKIKHKMAVNHDANPCQRIPIHTNTCQSMPTRANLWACMANHKTHISHEALSIHGHTWPHKGKLCCEVCCFQQHHCPLMAIDGHGWPVATVSAPGDCLFGDVCMLTERSGTF